MDSCVLASPGSLRPARRVYGSVGTCHSPRPGLLWPPLLGAHACSGPRGSRASAMSEQVRGCRTAPAPTSAVLADAGRGDSSPFKPRSCTGSGVPRWTWLAFPVTGTSGLCPWACRPSARLRGRKVCSGPCPVSIRGGLCGERENSAPCSCPGPPGRGIHSVVPLLP